MPSEISTLLSNEIALEVMLRKIDTEQEPDKLLFITRFVEAMSTFPSPSISVSAIFHGLVADE